MTANAVPGFDPAVHGLSFRNAFPPGPTLKLGPFDSRLVGVGDASAGLCGGMALTARDLYEAGVRAPTGDGTPPANGSPRFRALVRRQVQSLDWMRVPLRYLDLAALRPDPPVGLARRLRREPPRVEAVFREWPRIRAEIDAGHPSVVGLIRAAGGSPWRLTQNHQVLAWALRTARGRPHHAPGLRPQPAGARRRGARGSSSTSRRPDAVARPDPDDAVDRRAAARVLPPAVPAGPERARLALTRTPAAGVRAAAAPGRRSGAAANRSPTSATRVDDVADRPAVRAQVRVVELVPADRRGDRARPAAGRTAYGATSVLIARVLGVVEAGLAAALGLRPLPRHEVRHGRADGPRQLLDPGARLAEGVAPGSIGIQTWMPRLPVVLG